MAKKSIEIDSLQDELAGILATNLNKKFKSSNYKVAYFLEGDEDSPSEVSEWISTGSSMLDLAISNRPNGGLPVGRITEITGLEASGKSLLAAHVLANTQKKGGLAVYIDTENAISREFLTAIGVNLKDMLYVPLDTIEDIFDAIDSIIESVRKTDKNKIVTIVVDSVAGASTKIEMAADYDKDGYATSKALISLLNRQRSTWIYWVPITVILSPCQGIKLIATKVEVLEWNTRNNIKEEPGADVR